MNKIQQIIDLHLNQSYGAKKYIIDFDRLISQYSRMPNEAVYLIDCKNAQLIPLDSKFSKLTGIPIKSVDDITPLYEHISKEQFEEFASLTLAIVGDLGFGKKFNGMTNEKDWVNIVYRTHHNKVLLKSTTSLLRTEDGVMRYSIGKITDISNLGHNGQLSHNFTGINSAKITRHFYHQKDQLQQLTTREQQILLLIGAGAKSIEIAHRLTISEHTVHTHRKNIIEKLKVSGAINAYNKAKDLGYL